MATNFDAIINSKRPVLVDFHKPKLPHCTEQESVLHDVKSCLENRIAIVKVDVEKNKALATNYEVSHYPTLLLFKNGRQLWRRTGYIGKEELLSKIIEKNN
jgi:thioredoxin 1